MSLCHQYILAFLFNFPRIRLFIFFTPFTSHSSLQFITITYLPTHSLSPVYTLVTTLSNSKTHSTLLSLTHTRPQHCLGLALSPPLSHTCRRYRQRCDDHFLLPAPKSPCGYELVLSRGIHPSAAGYSKYGLGFCTV